MYKQVGGLHNPRVSSPVCFEAPISLDRIDVNVIEKWIQTMATPGLLTVTHRIFGPFAIQLDLSSAA